MMLHHEEYRIAPSTNQQTEPNIVKTTTILREKWPLSPCSVGPTSGGAKIYPDGTCRRASRGIEHDASAKKAAITSEQKMN